MSATVLLLKTQIRLLAWPFWVLMGAWLISAIVPLDAVDVLLGIAVILAGALSGPIVFGAEYVEGARDYLATRPGSSRSVFWSKTIVLLVYAALCTVALHGIFPSSEVLDRTYRNYSEPVLFLTFIFLTLAAISLWGALWTVLCRDMVRGILYGGVSFVVLLVLARSVEWWFFNLLCPPLVILPEGNIWEWNPALVFHPLLRLLAPLPILGLLESVHRSSSKRKMVITVSLPITTFLLLGTASAAWYGTYLDGSASVFDFGLNQGLTASGVRGHELRYTLDEEDMTAHSLDLSDPQSLETVTDTKMTEPLLNRFWQDGIIFDDRCLVFPYGASKSWDDRRLELYRVEDDSRLSPMRTIEDVQSAGLNRPGQMVIDYANDAPGAGIAILDLQTGEVSDVTRDAKGPEHLNIVETEDRKYSATSIGGITSIRTAVRVGLITDTEPLSNPTALAISKGARVTGATWVEVSPPLQTLVGVAVNEKLIAGFPVETKHGSYHLPNHNITTIQPEIRLYDTTRLPAPSYVRIPIPYRLSEFYRVTGRLLVQSGLTSHSASIAIEQGCSVELTLGGGYPFLWAHIGAQTGMFYFCRVAVWDVTNPEKPGFLGILPSIPGAPSEFDNNENPYRHDLIQPPLVPIKRSDGALGFPTGYKTILWLEIPERMKEPS